MSNELDELRAEVAALREDMAELRSERRTPPAKARRHVMDCFACGVRGSLLCNYPLGTGHGAQCDRALCARCAVQWHDSHLCPSHAVSVAKDVHRRAVSVAKAVPR